MTHSSSWSSGSAACRLEVRPSRASAWLVRAGGGLAALAAWGSALPWSAALPLSVAALLWSWALSSRLVGAPVVALLLPHDANRPALVDGNPVSAFGLAWRGPLIVLRWHAGDGRPASRVALPDSLDACMRRELRLAWRARQPARPAASMAP